MFVFIRNHLRNPQFTICYPFSSVPIRSSFIHNILGPGLLESAYEGAYCIELAKAGIPFSRQQVYPLHYKGELVGGCIADLVVDNSIILELKSVQQLHTVMEAQLINYLKLFRLPVGYLINFNSTRIQWKRFVNKRE